MEKTAQVFKQVKDLDEKGLISLKYIKIWLISLFVTFLALLWFWSLAFSHSGGDGVSRFHGGRKVAPTLKFNKKSKTWYGINSIHMTLIVTDDGSDSLEKCLTTIKSAIVFSTKILHFHIFADEEMYQLLLTELEEFPIEVRHRVSFTFKSVYGAEAQRGGFNLLLVPLSFHYLNEMLYARSGVAFTSSLDILWEDFVFRSKSGDWIMSAELGGSTSPVSANVTSRMFAYNNQLVFYNLKLLRRSRVKFPTDFRHLPYTRAPLAHASPYQNYTWAADMIQEFETMLPSGESNVERALLNLIVLYNPALVSAFPSKNQTNNFSFLPPAYYVAPEEKGAARQRWKLLSNVFQQVDLLDVKEQGSFTRFTYFIAKLLHQFFK